MPRKKKAEQIVQETSEAVVQQEIENNTAVVEQIEDSEEVIIEREDVATVKDQLSTNVIPEDIERFDPDIKKGLDDEQVNLRISQNLINKDSHKSGKTTWQIIRDNVFTFFNMLLLLIGCALIAFGLYEQVTFLVIAIVNTVIGIVQELKAKKTLAKLKLVTNSNVRVIRKGNKSIVSNFELVLDDVYEITSGDQIPSDSVIKVGSVEVNESLITGESKPVKKKVGDKLYAGSFLVSGACTCKADKVGDYNYISSIQSKAKELNKPQSELVKSMNLVIKVIGFIIIPLGLLTFWSQWGTNAIEGRTTFQIAQAAFSNASGSMIGMIPSGMYLLISIALAKSVMTLSKKNAMVQDLYSVEMLARVDTLCLDKTGTLTDGTMRVDEMLLIDDSYNLEDLMGSYLNAFSDSNQTSIALSQKYPLKNVYKVIDSIPFSSARKFSVVEFKGIGTFALGAPEYLYKGKSKEILNYIANKQASGYRAVILCKCDNSIDDGKIKGRFSPVVVFFLEDHIRPEASSTIKWFIDNDVNIKIISGDNPLTASEIAKKCGVPNAEMCISLEGLSEEEVKQIVNSYTVFGRVTPEQKACIVRELKNQGHTVGMTGDGVNDILAMKTSDCSIAMANGSSAARNVAHLVLLDSNFASMPLAVQEGRRCINNVQRSSALYLMKTIFTVVFTVIVLLTFLSGGNGIEYPFKPNNLFIMESVCIGISSIFLALQKDDSRITGHFLKNTFSRAIPAAICLILAISANYIMRDANDFLEIQNLENPSLSFTTLCSLTMVVISLAMSYNCFLPITPLKKNGNRAFMFALVFVLCIIAIFAFPFIPFGGTNLANKFIGIDFRSLNKTCWLLLAIYGIAAITVLASMMKVFTSLFEKKITHEKKEKEIDQ